MKTKFLYLMAVVFCSISYSFYSQTLDLNKPIVKNDVTFEEKNGLVAVEAEYFNNQSKTEIRQWYITSIGQSAKVGRDDDSEHCNNASNNAYIEVLPDTRVTHSDKLIHGENFSNQPGKIAILSYKIKFNNSGRYYVWVRAMSTGSEDNGIHVGLNGEWPDHGQRMQWCEGKRQWTWASKQRTKEEHCGIPHAIYLDIKNAGVYNVQFSMREDGFEFDKFVLTTDINYVPVEQGPKLKLAHGTIPKSLSNIKAPKSQKSYFRHISNFLTKNRYIASQEFPLDGTNFYKNGKNWLAINPKEHKEAKTSTIFNFESGSYDIVFVGVGENDGSSHFDFFVNDKKIGAYAPPLSKNMFEEGKKFNALWENVQLNKGDKITVVAKVGTDGNEWTRGRWAGVVFAPLGKGKEIQDAPSSYTAN
ncbi:hypothetical protein SAMN05421824_2288 [Hyunsoonleella jejuensis]|uniref:Uncharacterized protein n=1 Tax=Hyunsoonleella jejuensis TaxID=419940 RepID=A0A1H9IUA1_9FLAO|nr:hypothetical protein [Hyunsoonleella jejuensis]SEQ78173.1 hypothetical protein SAMN05421824_2288 [Hyunsoonleella jejuensis]